MTIGHLLRATPTLFRVGLAQMVAYRAEMVIWILTATMPLIMLALWNAVVTEAPVEGFGPTEMTRYFTVTLLVRQLTSSWLLWEMNHEIRTGALSPRLLRPVPPLVIDAMQMLAAMPVRVIVLLPMLVGLVIWRPELVELPQAWELLLFLPSVFLAWLLGYLVQALFAMLSFWIDQSQGLFGVWFSLWMVMSGYLAPLALFPKALQPAMTYLPFRGMLAAPVELLTGLQTFDLALLDLGVQLVWCTLALGATYWVWKRGIARYGAFGA